MPQKHPEVTLMRWLRLAPDSTHERPTKRCSFSFVKYAIDFCNSTSFHGFKYITEEKRHWIERVLWAFMCAMGMAGAVVLINKVWTQYSTSPTITSIESTHFPIWNIPFPAVTVCQVNKVHLSAAVTLYREENDVPLRVNGAGYLTGLSMLIDPRLEDYYAALFSFYGVQVLVHANRDYPEISARGILLSPRKEAFLQVSAATTYSTTEVRALSREQRQCLFEDEQTLENSSDVAGGYSYSNCLVQCRMEHMDMLCQCAPYFYPTGNNTRLCGLTDVACLADHRRVFNNLRSPNFVPGLDDNENAMECDCHPTCTDVSYSTEISESNFFKSEYDQTNFFKEVPITNHSILHVYFKDLSVLRFRRDVIYSWNDLLASFGGIVGLTLGSSLLSFVELLYFFTVRPACTLLLRDAVEPLKVLPAPKKGVVPPPYDWVF